MWYAVLVLGARVNVSPVEKVVTLLHDLRTQVQEEGSEEAQTYDKFACFCRDTTDLKVQEIADKEESVQTLTSDAHALSTQVDQLSSEVLQLNNDISQLEAELKEMTELREKEHADYAVSFADMSKAVSSLEKAIESISGSQMSLGQVRALVRPAVLLADAMSLLPAKAAKSALLEEADVPESDYDFHSGDILSTLDGLLDTFKNKKAELESNESAAQGAYDETSSAKNTELDTSKESLATKESQLTTAQSDLAVTQEDLTETTALMHDDRTYLKDLTEKCETKANEWDQRSAQRTDELSAISTAIEIIEGTVQDKALATGAGGRSAAESTNVDALAAGLIQDSDIDDYTDVVFVQTKEVRRADLPRNKAIAFLKATGASLHSPELAMLAVRMAEDPFAKVKGLIQQLINRLLAESADEATHKGWCDTELGKARNTRESRHKDVSSLTADTATLEARQAHLKEEKANLETAIAELRAALATATEDRGAEKADNEAALANSREGLVALQQAIRVLSDFYKKAAKAFVQASPVDEDAPAAGFSGSYQGNQAKGEGILGMLATIESDFERTISTTSAAEDQAHRDFVAFSKETGVSLSRKETGLRNVENDLTQTRGDLVATLNDLHQQQELLDKALETLEKLRPACIDTGMSYEERVSRREAEIAALKNALEILSEGEGFLQK